MKYLLLILVTLSAFAQDDNDITHRPKSFNYNKDKAVFVDFQEVTYFITYDVPAKKSEVKAVFKMNVVEEGHPIFDLVADPTLVKLDGVEIGTTVVSTPSQETNVRVVDRKLSIGTYEFEVVAPITTLTDFTEKGVKSAFWVTDLEDRFYLERYIPTNLEYDRMTMTFDINFKGIKTSQHLFANGKVKWMNPDRAIVEYPAHFTVNSLYFHTTPVGTLDIVEFPFQSSDGRNIPVTIYTAKSPDASRILNDFKSKTQKVLTELEGDYGPFPHGSVTIYNASLSSMGLGGMEYAGATVTDIYSLDHELFHSYFARGLVPANGNAGWIDEAFASWRDNGYNRRTTLTGASRMAAHAPYTRKTDTAAYGFGARFMAYLDNKLAGKGGLKPFMHSLLQKKLFTPIFTEEFIQEMEDFFEESLESTFKTYVYGKNQSKIRGMMHQHPIHRKMRPEHMKQLL